MSNIYVQEPPTNGKVVITTTLGEIEIELWSKECPKACRNFVQLCLEKFYDSTIFHRVVPSFIAQGGDPSGTGHGGESIYGEAFKNEVHSRIRFVRRGLVATANTGNNDNESQFFFTLGACPELQNKHTIFGKVGGDTLFNMIKFNDLDCDREDRPYHPPKILKTEVINNPFPDIVPRVDESKKDDKKDERKKIKGTKNLKLLSFGEEEEEDEQETMIFNKSQNLKGKSSHDLTNDPTLSAVPAVDKSNESECSDDEMLAPCEGSSGQLEKIQSKLKQARKTVDSQEDKIPVEEIDSDEERKEAEQRKLNSIRDEIKSLKRELVHGKDSNKDSAKKMKLSLEDESKDDEDETNDVLKDFHMQQKKYAPQKLGSKNKSDVSKREADTLALLNKFKQKLSQNTVERDGRSSAAVPEESEKEDGEEEEVKGDSWLKHTLKFADAAPNAARDANLKGDDWFEIYDPRNPLNKRRREESKKLMKEKGKTKESDL